MTELEKLEAGLEYDFWDKDVNERKLYAIDGCKKINGIDQKNEGELSKAIVEFFGSAGEAPFFHCDMKKRFPLCSGSGQSI